MRQRITNAHAQAAACDLSDRDKAILQTVGSCRLMTAHQVRIWHFAEGSDLSSARRCRRTLERLTEQRWLTRLERRIGGQAGGSGVSCYALDVAGQRLVAQLAAGGRYRRPKLPGVAFVVHTLAVTELAVRLVEAERTGRLKLAGELAPEPSCWTTYHGPSGEPLRLKPDLAVSVEFPGGTARTWVEVDLGTEAAGTLQRKFRAYADYWLSGGGAMRRVLWLVPTDRRYQQLVDQLARQPADYWPLHQVALFDQAVEVLSRPPVS